MSLGVTPLARDTKLDATRLAVGGRSASRSASAGRLEHADEGRRDGGCLVVAVDARRLGDARRCAPAPTAGRGVLGRAVGERLRADAVRPGWVGGAAARGGGDRHRNLVPAGQCWAGPTPSLGPTGCCGQPSRGGGSGGPHSGLARVRPVGGLAAPAVGFVARRPVVGLVRPAVGLLRHGPQSPIRRRRTGTTIWLRPSSTTATVLTSSTYPRYLFASSEPAARRSG